MTRTLSIGLGFAVLLSAALSLAETPSAWPEPSQSSRPWTRWWWHGSAVDEGEITRLLEEYRRVGLGGVEVTCIYGVKGEPHPNRLYRSPEWRAALRYTLAESKRLGLGVDLPAGSGWRMGDPELPIELANSRLVLDHRNTTGPREFAYDFTEKVTPQSVSARSASGEVVDLTPLLKGRRLRWQAPAGDWRIDLAGYQWSGDRVKRPAPGGEGLNVNPFWRRSVEDFLTRFSTSLEGLDGIRSQFHDSFEYDGDWQPEFFEEFAIRRGFRLEEYLPELAGDADPERVGRVKADYRQTLEDLVREHLVGTWVDWSHAHGMLARNQSHGSPANWLDLYAACDIPEIESFGRLNGRDADPLILKFASSAANVTGKRLVSAETATWLDEHFHVTLAQVKQIVDRQALAGVNHVVYHGTAYSPADAAWPGWVFYASTQLNPQNTIWRDLPALNEYVTRVQSLLQASQPDGDVLLYWALSDWRHDPNGMRQEMRVHNSREWFTEQPIGEVAQKLSARGHAFDYVSDRLLKRCDATSDGAIKAPGGEYRAIVVPRAETMPLETAEKLAELAGAGVQVFVWGELPQSLPGLAGDSGEPRWANERSRFTKAMSRLRANGVIGDSLDKLLDAGAVRREAWSARTGIAFHRRLDGQHPLYFLNNPTPDVIDAWITPAAASDSYQLLSPSTGKAGLAATRPSDAGDVAVRIQLEPGESLFLRGGTLGGGAPWPYRDAAAEPIALRGWRVEFLNGGPAMPEPFACEEPRPWTEAQDPAAEAFAGTARYACRFTPETGAARWRLELGEVLGSVRVRLNGAEIATLIGPTFAVDLSGLLEGENLIEIEVTGVAANRIRDLDRRGVRWKIFEDINVVGIDYKPLNARSWPVQPQGLQGPVTLTALRETATVGPVGDN